MHRASAIADPALPVLEARSLDAGYQGVPAVRGLDVTVRPGEVVALLGPNGAGKTTTLMTLAGALKPLAGSVVLDNHVVTSPVHERARAGLALLTERRAIVSSLSVSDNLKLGGGDPKRGLEVFPELEARLSIRAGLLSGGEQQMLALARIFATNARILLADELSLGLAPLVTERLLKEIRAAADRGMAVLLVEQHAHKALEMADRVVVLVRGEAMLECDAHELRGDVDRLSSLYFD